MHIYSKITKFIMYNNSNGGVEHRDSTATASKEDVSQAETKTEVLNAEKPADADGKPGLSEGEAVQEEEEAEAAAAEAQDDVAGTEEHTVVEIIEKSTPDDEAEENVERLEEAEHLDEEALDAKQDEEHAGGEDDGEDDKKIIIEVLHEKEAGADEEKSNLNLEMCRVCMGTEELTDIFQLEGPIRVSDIIMKVCTNIRITARDHLPHKICDRCLGQVRIVNEFKIRCEASDKELRKNLKRSTNKSRRSSDFIVVNCPMSDSDKDDEEPVDDDEYKVSQSEVESEPATSDDSFSPPNKRKRTPKRRGRAPGTGRRGRPGRKPKNMATSTPAALTTYTPKRGPGRPPKYPKTPSLSNIVYIEAPEDSSSSGEEEEVKRKRRKRGDNPCPKCDQVLPSQNALKEHMKSHPSDRFNCDRCSLFYRTERALQNHIERHKKADRLHEEKRKQREERIEQRLRDTPKSSENEKSKLTSSFGSVGSEKKKKAEATQASSGRDLFKCVAPPTSTYWSDSFSD